MVPETSTATGRFFFVILGHFLNYENITKIKTTPGDIIFYTSAPKIMITDYIVPEIWHMMDVIVIFILGYFLPFYLLTAQKMKISKR